MRGSVLLFLWLESNPQECAGGSNVTSHKAHAAILRSGKRPTPQARSECEITLHKDRLTLCRTHLLGDTVVCQQLVQLCVTPALLLSCGLQLPNPLLLLLGQGSNIVCGRMHMHLRVWLCETPLAAIQLRTEEEC